MIDTIQEDQESLRTIGDRVFPFHMILGQIIFRISISKISWLLGLSRFSCLISGIVCSKMVIELGILALIFPPGHKPKIFSCTKGKSRQSGILISGFKLSNVKQVPVPKQFSTSFVPGSCLFLDDNLAYPRRKNVKQAAYLNGKHSRQLLHLTKGYFMIYS